MSFTMKKKKLITAAKKQRWKLCIDSFFNNSVTLLFCEHTGYMKGFISNMLGHKIFRIEVPRYSEYWEELTEIGASGPQGGHETQEFDSEMILGERKYYDYQQIQVNGWSSFL